MPEIMTGWLNTPPFSLAEAQQRGADVYEVIYRDWGLGEDSQWPPAGQPSMPISLAAIAIGPRSTVDRCWISYNLQKDQLNLGVEPADTLTNRLRYLSVGHPLLFQQTANPGKSNTPGSADDPLLSMVHKGTLYAYCSSNFNGLGFNVFGEYFGQAQTTIMPGGDGVADSYQDINGNIIKINKTIPVAYDGPMFIGPQLHLMLYLKPPISIPTKRSPLQVGGQRFFPPGNAEALIANVATFGRSNIQITMWSDTQCDFRVGAIRGGANPILNWPQEAPLDAQAAVPANTRVVLSSCNTQGVYADWCNLYATPAAAGAIIRFLLTAYD